MLFRRQVFIIDIERSRCSQRLTERPSLFEPSSLTLTIKLGVSMSATVLFGTWLKTKEAITTGNNTDTEAKLIYVFKMGGKS